MFFKTQQSNSHQPDSIKHPGNSFDGESGNLDPSVLHSNNTPGAQPPYNDSSAKS